MGRGIKSEDMAAICLAFSGYDLCATMSSVLEQAWSYMDTRSRYFGEDYLDFQGAIIHLSVKSGITEWRNHVCGPTETAMHCTPLYKFIMLMLEYKGVWFNDEGEYWHESDDAWDWYEEPLQMCVFFDRTPLPGKNEVKEFLEIMGKGSRIKERFTHI
jgi:hypothetical protein